MADKTFEEQLQDNQYYVLARKTGLIDDKHPTTQLELNQAIHTAWECVKKTALSDEQLEKLTSEEQDFYMAHYHPDEFKTQAIGSPTKIKVDAMADATTVESLDDKPTPSTPPVVNDNQWMEQKRAFWMAYAEKIGHKLTEPDAKEPNTFAGELLKDGQSKGTFKYTAPDKVQVSSKADLVIYQGIVADAVAGHSPLVLGKTLNDQQRLMLYAAALLSTKDGHPVKVINPPVLTPDMEKSAMFKALPENVRNILIENKHPINRDEILDKSKKREQKGDKQKDNKPTNKKENSGQEKNQAKGVKRPNNGKPVYNKKKNDHGSR